MLKSLSGVAVAAVVLLLGQPAAAQTITTTFAGFVAADDSDGMDLDVANLFGGGDLQGLPILATFTYDTRLGTELTDGETFDEIDGGPDYDSNPVLFVRYLINGFNYTYSPDQKQDLTTQSPVTGVTPGYLSFTAYSSDADQSLVQIETAAAPASLQSPFRGEADSGTVGGLLTYFNPGRTNTDELDTITFDVTNVVAAARVVSAAPEPSSWLLMLLGVGCGGWAMRASRKVQKCAASLIA